MTASARFDEQGVLLNEHGLAAAGRFFPLRGLRGATVHLAHRRYRLAAVLCTLGLIAMVAGVLGYGHVAAVIGGLMLAVVGILNWYIQDVVHYLYVETTDGAREAVASADPAFLERVAKAIDAAVAEQRTNASH